MPSARPVLLLTLLACAQASASGAGDDLDRFLSARGLGEPAAAHAETRGPADTASRALAPAVRATDPGAAGEPADRMSNLVVAAMGALGVPYRRGGNTFDAGYDCSGFVRAIYEQNVGVMLPRVAAQQAAATHAIERSELQPGDLVFFNTLRRSYSHVGIYVGDHRFIHSPRPGAVVRIEDMRVGYWSSRFDGARRVTGTPGTTASLQPTTVPAHTYPNY